MTGDRQPSIGSRAKRFLGALLAAPFRFYQLFLSPLKPPTCRFSPTCSEYATVALRRHGPLYGGWLTLRRLSKCHPIKALGASSGFDPVPEVAPAGDRGAANQTTCACLTKTK